MAFRVQEHAMMDIDNITISLASQMIFYQDLMERLLSLKLLITDSFRPEKDGLFCEKIFGPLGIGNVSG